LRLVAGGWFVLREKYCWLVADKPSEQAVKHGMIMNDWFLQLAYKYALCDHGSRLSLGFL
jgi:hypothetical protein